MLPEALAGLSLAAPAQLDRRFCIAPMMDYSDRHSRYFLRLFSPRILLYTEMVTAAAILNGDRDYLLQFNAEEHPLGCNWVVPIPSNSTAWRKYAAISVSMKST